MERDRLRLQWAVRCAEHRLDTQGSQAGQKYWQTYRAVLSPAPVLVRLFLSNCLKVFRVTFFRSSPHPALRPPFLILPLILLTLTPNYFTVL